MKKKLAKIPGVRPFYRQGRRAIKNLTRPLLDLLLKFHGYTYRMWDVVSDKNCDFINDPDFMKGYEAAQKQEKDSAVGCWVVYINQWAAFHAINLEGDFVECGVNRGRLSMSNITSLDWRSLKNRKYYLFDTFSGLDSQFSTEKELNSYRNAYPECYDFVVKSFRDYPNVMIIRGTVPKTLTQVTIDRVAFLHIDMNCVVPEMEAMKFFWPRLAGGGVVLLDDYAQKGHENQKKAMDEFAASQGVKILSLPTGQGLVIKP